ncbi:MAG: hypothetical protein ACPLRW_07535 [Moorellales bacterium]
MGKVKELDAYGVVTHVSKRLNLIVMEVPPHRVETLRRHPNVLNARESEVGEYQI